MDRSKIEPSEDVKLFKLILNEKWFSRGDIIRMQEKDYYVSNDYRITWWKKILKKFGFRFKCFNNDFSWGKIKPINK